MVTSLTAKQDRILGIEAGAEDFLSKPFDLTEVLARIKILLKVKELHDARVRAEAALQKSHDELDSQVQERTAELAEANAMLQADIVKLQQADEALQRSEAYIKNILETVDEGFVVVDRQYVILSANKAYCNAAELSAEQVIGRRCHEVSHHCDKPCLEIGEECPVKRTFETGATQAGLHTHTSDNGNKYHVEIKSYPVTDTSGNVVSVIETITDVTEKIKLEAQLRHAQKMEAVGTLAGGIAHDFNNILNVILGYGTMVMETLAADSPAKDNLQEVLAAADRAADLTKRLLIFSQKQVVEVKSLNLNELILGLQKMLLRIISENIDFKLELTDSLLIVLADGGQIEQVLINLAVNAKDAMPNGGRLTITTRLREVDAEYVAAYGYGKPGRYALITVADTGHGIDAEIQKKIFEPFFTTKGVGQGTGLGLAISYGIIKQHNGYIKVYSEPGQGTEFKIYLPLSEEAARPDQKRAVATPVEGGNETILLAEDDAALQAFTRITLESFGYTVIAASDGDEAIAGFMENRERISLLLLDMIMPKKNGTEVCEVISKVSPDIKVLFTSGYGMDTSKAAALTAAGVYFIPKPFRSTELLHKVREILDK
ncbi:MAG: response regulator [Desulfobulbaceae bacterium]|nr:response regulator [Desulfobulbaceae bacterium]